MADNIRSIPSMVDGFKPGQRKVLFGCFKRKLKKEIKVAQLAGYVAEHSAYHHGEVGLTATIVGLAQSFVGSNNINVLEPNGQFGTRIAVSLDCWSQIGAEDYVRAEKMLLLLVISSLMSRASPEPSSAQQMMPS